MSLEFLLRIPEAVDSILSTLLSHTQW